MKRNVVLVSGKTEVKAGKKQCLQYSNDIFCGLFWRGVSDKTEAGL